LSLNVEEMLLGHEFFGDVPGLLHHVELQIDRAILCCAIYALSRF